MAPYEEKLKIYDDLVSRCKRFERKGKTMPYTSANGHMFSLFNKAGYFTEWETTIFKSYNSIMHGYVLIPDHMLNDLDKLAKYLDESYDYVMSLEPK